jgi:pimeloyl-ACP methyl ester carboxylesterase
MQVAFVGHSQGGTLALALLARRPEFGTYFSSVITLGPVVYAKYMRSPVMVSFCRAANVSGVNPVPLLQNLVDHTPAPCAS